MKQNYTSIDMRKIVAITLGSVGIGLIAFLCFAGTRMVKKGSKGTVSTTPSSNHFAAVPTPHVSKQTAFRIPILMYHYVEYVQDKGDTIRQSLDITPYTFEQEIKTLADNGYTFLTAKDLGNALDGIYTPPTKSVILTFDDGYRDFYTDAYPILKKYHAKATMYMIAGFVGYRNYMTEAQLKEIAADGLIDIGAHTVHHMSLKQAPIDEVRKELTDGKKMIEDLIHMPVVSFAYPNGSFDDVAIHEVFASGYTTAVTTQPGSEENPTNRFKLFRIRPGGTVGNALIQRMEAKNISMY